MDVSMDIFMDISMCGYEIQPVLWIYPWILCWRTC